MTGTDKPPIVLVHGAFADASGWAGISGNTARTCVPTVFVEMPGRVATSLLACPAPIMLDAGSPRLLVHPGHPVGMAQLSGRGLGVPRISATDVRIVIASSV